MAVQEVHARIAAQHHRAIEMQREARVILCAALLTPRSVEFSIRVLMGGGGGLSASLLLLTWMSARMLSGVSASRFDLRLVTKDGCTGRCQIADGAAEVGCSFPLAWPSPGVGFEVTDIQV